MRIDNYLNKIIFNYMLIYTKQNIIYIYIYIYISIYIIFLKYSLICCSLSLNKS